MGKKLLTYAVAAFTIFFVAYRPDAAARVTRLIGALLARIATGFGDFFSSLV
jgi:uncharacterized membrane protein